MSEAWRPIETAPKDDTLFLCLIDGLPYLARFDEHGRFVWYWHSDDGTGPSYIVHKIGGTRLLEETKPRDPPHYIARGHLWVNGFNEQKRTHWMPLPKLPDPTPTPSSEPAPRRMPIGRYTAMPGRSCAEENRDDPLCRNPGAHGD